MWPLALITKPVPVLPTVRETLGFAGAAFGASDAAATALGGAAKSPALLTPSALTLVTQLASAASSGPAELRLNCKGVPRATATIRLDFWKVRARFGGRMAEIRTAELAVANSLAWTCPSKVTSIGSVSPLVK